MCPVGERKGFTQLARGEGFIDYLASPWMTFDIDTGFLLSLHPCHSPCHATIYFKFVSLIPIFLRTWKPPCSLKIDSILNNDS